MIPIGTAAPDARVAIRPREWVTLHQLFDGRPALLLFFPLAFSGTCTQEMCRMAEDGRLWEDAGIRPFGISVDSPYTNIRFAEETGVRFPILSDFNREAMVAYDVVRPDLGGLREVPERVVFVIDAAGVVRWVWQGEHPGVLPPFDRILEAVRQLV